MTHQGFNVRNCFGFGVITLNFLIRFTLCHEHVSLPHVFPHQVHRIVEFIERHKRSERFFNSSIFCSECNRHRQVILRELHYTRHEVAEAVYQVATIDVGDSLERHIRVFKWTHVT